MLDPQSFAYWLQGFAELHGAPPTPAQWEMIKEHLALVFTKVTVEDTSTPLGVEGKKVCAQEPTYCNSVATKEPGMVLFRYPNTSENEIGAIRC